MALRPDVELCYLGLLTQCFEILEKAPDSAAAHGGRAVARAASPNHPPWTPDHDSDSDFESAHGPLDEDEDDDEADETAEEDEYEGGAMAAAVEEAWNAGAAEDEEALSEDDEVWEKKVQFELREILFYSEKVEIFRVRHATL